MKPILSVTTMMLLGARLWCIGAEVGDAPFANGRWLDLTHSFSSNTIYWPTAQPFVLETEFHAHTEKGYFYAANRFSASEHGGTHVDAPIHFAEGRKTLDQLSIEQLIGAAVVVDVSTKAATNADYQVTVADIEAWESRLGRIPVGAIVLFNTGFARHWPDARKYLGTAERGAEAVAKLHFPGLHPEAAQWLAQNRSVRAVGIDTASIDFGQSTHFQSHVALFEKNIPALENVANLDQLPEAGFVVLALPMKIRGGSGGPVRIVGVLNP